MIWRNFIRDLRHTASRLISVMIITMLAVAVYTGLSGIPYNVDLICDGYFDAQNLADYWITGIYLDQADCRKLAQLSGVTRGTAPCGGRRGEAGGQLHNPGALRCVRQSYHQHAPPVGGNHALQQPGGAAQ